MRSFDIALEDATAAFYTQLAQHVDVPVEQVLADALFKLAGELSLEALRSQR